MVAHAHKQCKRAGVSSLGSRGQCAVRISQKISKPPAKADTIIKFVVNDPRWAADDNGPSPQATTGLARSVWTMRLTTWVSAALHPQSVAKPSEMLKKCLMSEARRDNQQVQHLNSPKYPK